MFLCLLNETPFSSIVIMYRTKRYPHIDIDFSFIFFSPFSKFLIFYTIYRLDARILISLSLFFLLLNTYLIPSFWLAFELRIQNTAFLCSRKQKWMIASWSMISQSYLPPYQKFLKFPMNSMKIISFNVSVLWMVERISLNHLNFDSMPLDIN